MAKKNRAALALNKLRHAKHKYPREYYQKMSEKGRAGREAYWKKRREEKEALDNASSA